MTTEPSGQAFKESDNEWLSITSDSIEASEGRAAKNGQSDSSNKEVPLTQQRVNARQENDKG